MNYTGTLSPYNYFLFARNVSGTPNFEYAEPVAIKYVKIFDNDTLVRDYLPMIDEFGVGAMFDKVTHSIFDNAGTGAFKYPARQVEYLESTGTQYIDTGTTDKSSLKLKIDFAVSTLEDSKCLFGEYTSAKNFQFISYTNRFVPSLGNGNGQHIPSDTDKHTVLLDGANLKAYLDDNEITLSTTSYTGAGNPIYLFGRYFNGSVGNNIKAKIYKTEIYDGTILVRDFIPAFKDGETGMYDQVNDVFYTNAGSGDFVCGPVKEDEYE